MKIITPDAMDSSAGRFMSETDRFCFDCHAGLSCFNQCCRNLNLFLYPYDVLRLKNNLGVSAAEFLDQYVDVVMREGNYFPDVLLTMSETKEKTCPFLSGKGCSVYPDRSYSCRMFPVEQGVWFEDSDSAGRLVYSFRPPDFCCGQNEKRFLTIQEWIDDQGASLYVHMTRQWAGVKALFGQNPWGAEGPYGPKGKMAYMAAYNIDAFKGFLFNSSFFNRYRVPDEIQVLIKTDESDLLLFGFEWIKHFVWGIPSPWLGAGAPAQSPSK